MDVIRLCVKHPVDGRVRLRDHERELEGRSGLDRDRCRLQFHDLAFASMDQNEDSNSTGREGTVARISPS